VVAFCAGVASLEDRQGAAVKQFSKGPYRHVTLGQRAASAIDHAGQADNAVAAEARGRTIAGSARLKPDRTFERE
jgi:hypothetical protein